MATAWEGDMDRAVKDMPLGAAINENGRGIVDPPETVKPRRKPPTKQRFFNDIRRLQDIRIPTV